MQTNDKNSIDQEIQQVLIELDSNKILSDEEKLELKDHFLCEVEELTDLGLREEEALLVAKKRFGVLEDVNQEFQKVKSGFDLLRFGIIGVVAFCMIKILAISVDMISQVFWLIFYHVDAKAVLLLIALDIPFRFVLILIIGFVASKLITKMKFNTLASLWKFPIFYILAEVISRLYYFTIPSMKFNAEVMWHMEYFNNRYVINYIFLVFIMIFASYKMYKMKVLDMEYV